eukprot:gene15389-23527_t
MLLVSVVAASLSAGEDLLIWQYPMVMAHDAATGYLKEDDINKPVYEWTITQVGKFDELLECGARSLDLRPAVNEKGDLIMHHGAVLVHTALSTAIKDIINWLSANPTEFVLPVVADCTGANCEQSVTALMEQMHVPVVGCSSLTNMTMGQAKNMTKLSTGGSLMVVFDCSANDYDPKIGCYPPYERSHSQAARGTADEEVLSCYGDAIYNQTAFNAMWKYMNRTSVQFPKPGSLSQLQCLWQEGVNTIALGDLYGSSLIKDETRSELNLKALQKLQDGWFKNVNLFEINNVCDQGKAIAAELLQRVNNAR